MRKPIDRCRILFKEHDLAVRRDQYASVMVITLGERQTYLLRQYSTKPGFTLSKRSYCGGEVMPLCEITPDTISVPNWAEEVLTQGMPIPVNWSLLGWKVDGVVTAVIATFTSARDEPDPTWLPIVRIGSDVSQWPQFVTDSYEEIGQWLWNGYNNGDLVSLAKLIADTSESVYWVEGEESSYLYVKHDVVYEGITLPAGAYAFSERVKAGLQEPSEAVLEGRHDLAPDFQKYLESDLF